MLPQIQFMSSKRILLADVLIRPWFSFVQHPTFFVWVSRQVGSNKKRICLTVLMIKMIVGQHESDGRQSHGLFEQRSLRANMKLSAAKLTKQTELQSDIAT